MADMRGKRVLMTGATNGIGEAAALAFAEKGASITSIARNREKADALNGELLERGATSADVIIADLSLVREAKRAAAELVEKHDRLDVLANNAGAVFVSREETDEGFERTFALNHLGHFALTLKLLPLLRATQGARVINTSSHAHLMIDDMFWDDLQLSRRWPRRGWDAYCQSKLANVLFTYELARRLRNDDVMVNAFHPGFVRTGLGKNNGLLAKVLVPIITAFGARTPEKGAATLVWAASAEEMRDVTGKYLYDRRITRSSPASRDPEKQGRLFRLSEEMTETFFDESETKDASKSTA